MQMYGYRVASKHFKGHYCNHAWLHVFNGCFWDHHGIGHCTQDAETWDASEHQLSECIAQLDYSNTTYNATNLTYIGDGTDADSMKREDARARMCDCIERCYLPSANDDTTAIDGPNCPYRPPHDNVTAPTYQQVIYVVARRACNITNPETFDGENTTCPASGEVSSGEVEEDVTRYYFCDGPYGDYNSLVPCPPLTSDHPLAAHLNGSAGTIVRVSHGGAGSPTLLDVFIEGSPANFSGARVVDFTSRFANFTGVSPDNFTIVSVQSAGSGRRLSMSLWQDAPGTTFFSLLGRLLRNAVATVFGASSAIDDGDTEDAASTVATDGTVTDPRRLETESMTLVIIEVPAVNGARVADRVEHSTADELSSALDVHVMSVQVISPDGVSSGMKGEEDAPETLLDHMLDTQSYTSRAIWQRALLLSIGILTLSASLAACTIALCRRTMHAAACPSPNRGRVRAIWGQGAKRVSDGADELRPSSMLSTHEEAECERRLRARAPISNGRRWMSLGGVNRPSKVPTVPKEWKEVAMLTDEPNDWG